MIQVHGTSVAWKESALLLRGPPGSGKSDLALRLIEAGAGLIADDQTRLTVQKGRLYAASPPSITGLLEIRGIGIVKVKAAPAAPLALVVDLVSRETLERSPEVTHCIYLDVTLPRLCLAPFEASAVAKLRHAMLASRDGGCAA
ncbi:MAG: HPr kinase/phosphatase C-terminal domain-containing protein [Alphaproteobacteria bacterium]|nr:HPr kinase/phosphatase C-terminal domain-containing protein [Alphaproteobacteria bacterium]